PVSLSEMKGRIVYLEFWAPACGPCVKGMRYLKKLIESMPHDSVAFIMVSDNDDPRAWMKFLKKERPGGIQLLADGPASHRLRSAYQFSGIPRYVLLDQFGRIAVLNAPRPSGNASAEIRKLLKKM